jgi:hypothetical protein
VISPKRVVQPVAELGSLYDIQSMTRPDLVRKEPPKRLNGKVLLFGVGYLCQELSREDR